MLAGAILIAAAIAGVFFLVLLVIDLLDLRNPPRKPEPRAIDDICGSSWLAWGELHLCSLSPDHAGNHACRELHPGWPLRCVEKIEQQPAAVEKVVLRGRRCR